MTTATRCRRAWRRTAAGSLGLTLVLGTLALAAGCTRTNPAYQEVPEGTPETDGGSTSDDGGEPGPTDSGLPEGNPAARFEVVARGGSTVYEDEEFELEVTVLDEAGQPTRAYSGQLLLRASRGDIRPRSVDVAHLDGRGRVRIPVRLDREGTTAITVEDRPLLGETTPLRVRHGRWEAQGSPVLSWGAVGSWEELEVNMAEVRTAADRLVLFYRGRPGWNAPVGLYGGIGRAVSTDGGRSWNRLASNPLLSDEVTSSTLFLTLSSPTFLPGDDGWEMWLTATPLGRTYIGRAVSADGVDWTRQPTEPVLAPEILGEHPQKEVRDPNVLLREGGGYQMWYTWVGVDGREGIGYATSDDGVAWQPHPDNPVFRPEAGAWDAITVAQPTVLHEGTVYRMWYAGDATFSDRLGDGAAIGYATSLDGIHWERSPDNPVLSPSGQAGSFDQYRVEHPTVVRWQNELLLLFSGSNSERWRIGRAERVRAAQPG